MKARSFGVAATCALAASSLIVGGAGNANAKSPEPTPANGQGHWTAKGWDPEPAAPGLNATQRAAERQKNLAVKKFQADLAAGRIASSPPVALAGRCGGTGSAGYFPVPVKQQPQQSDQWSGPASVSEALEALGAGSIQQRTLATKLKTSRTGTAWYGVWVNARATGYPVPDVMNQYRSRFKQPNYYIPTSVKTGSAREVRDYGSRTAYNFKRGLPILNYAWETPKSRYRLVGHPRALISHWYASCSIDTKTNLIGYADSASGSQVGWAKRVPRYSRLSAAALTHINSGRGYVW